MIRTHEAGTLRASDAGTTVTLAGWVARRRDHGGVTFLDLRDASGFVQVVVRESESVHDLRNEYCVMATGDVRVRPEGNENPDLPTGEIEVVVDTVEVLSRGRAAAVPDRRAQELEHQRGGAAELPLPRPAPRGRWPGRCACARKATKVIRDVMEEHGFLDVETPYPDPLHPRGRARLPGAGAPAAGHLVRAAAVPAAVQAAADGRRHGALLPDRALLPGRGLPRRPAAGVHPAGHRGLLRRPGGHPGGRRGGRGRGVEGDARRRDPAAAAADELRTRRWTATARTSRTCASARSSPS